MTVGSRAVWTSLASSLALAAALLSPTAVATTPEAPQATPPGAAASTSLTNMPGVALETSLPAMFRSYAEQSAQYRKMCGRWSGGDGTHSISWGGKRLWSFSDTYLGAGGLRPTGTKSSFIRNSSVLQKGAALRRTHTGGGTCKEKARKNRRYAKSAVAPRNGNAWYWNSDGMKVGKDVVRFHYKNTASGAYWRTTGWATTRQRAAAFRKAVPEGRVPQDRRTVKKKGHPIVWGKALLAEGRTVHVYGTAVLAYDDCPGCFLQTYVARTTKADLDKPGRWKFWNGATWVKKMRKAKALPGFTGAGDNFSVSRINGRYWLVTHEKGLAGGDIRGYVSSTPTGFTNAKAVRIYEPPEQTVPSTSPGDPGYRYHYDARVHTGWGNRFAGKVVISYNVNTYAVDLGCRSGNDYDRTIYRPRFITVPVSSFDPARATALSYTGAVPPRRTETPRTSGTDNQWFMKGPGDACPELPKAKKHVVSKSGQGKRVKLSWKSYGRGIWYRVERKSGSGWKHVTTVKRLSVKVQRPAKGTQAFRVVPFGSVSKKRGTPGRVKVPAK